jgi:glycosyltransferase domain-containing protein
MKSKICLIIPTHNRHKYVKRLLYYYISTQFALRIVVIDSSESDAASRNQKLVDELLKFKSNLVLEYHHTSERFPQESPPIVHEKIQWALGMVDAKYIAMCADDDFLVPGALEKFADFLDNNSDYCCARGRIYDFIASNDGSFRLLPAPHWFSVEAEDPCERVWLASRYYQQSFYALFRGDVLREVQNSLPARFLRKPSWMDELSFSTFAAVIGKMKRFDFPHEYRELHDSNYGHTVPRWPEMAFDEELRPFVTDYFNALKGLILHQHPSIGGAFAEKTAYSSLVAFSKWYYEIRYRDSQNRPRGTGTLEFRDPLLRLLDKTYELYHWLKQAYLRRWALRLPETRAVMVAVSEHKACSAPSVPNSHIL